jgi:chitinase
MASSVDAPVRAGYWYCDSEFPIPVASIPSQLFTHLFAASADVNPHTYEVTFPEKYKEQFSTFTQTVQHNNKNVKTLLSIDRDSTTFSSMARQHNTRKAFIDSSISLAKKNNKFHGLSLNWLYPSTESDMTNLGFLLNEWHAAVKKESGRTGKAQLLLVAAVNFRPTYRSLRYPVDDISRSLDWINVLAYDFYSPDRSWNVTGPFAALKNADNPHCGDTGVTAWLVDAHVPANKIVLGLPFYGYAWRLEDGNNKLLFPPADGPANIGPANEVHVAADGGHGAIFYNQIVLFRETHPNGKGEYIENFVFDYFRDGNTWIAYNGKKSIIAKVQYAREKQLLGYFASHLGADDVSDWTLSEAG